MVHTTLQLVPLAQEMDNQSASRVLALTTRFRTVIAGLKIVVAEMVALHVVLPAQSTVMQNAVRVTGVTGYQVLLAENHTTGEVNKWVNQ